MGESRIIYEFPITNRARSFLRFEYLIDKVESSMNGRNNSIETIQTLHELLELARYNDIKSELLRHIRWQEQKLLELSNDPPVNQDKLSRLVEEKQQIIKDLHEFNLPTSDYANNHFLNSTKLRLSVPGGTCSFDLPQLHAWLHFSDDAKHKELETWIKPFRRLKEALQNTLSLTRMSAEFSRETAENGHYINKSLPGKHPYCMIRIATENIPEIYPEVSSGPSHFTVYFFTIETLDVRPGQTRQDVPFELACCAL